MHAAGAPFWPFHPWHTLLRPASQRGTRREMMRHYVFLAKAVIGSERLWALLLCTSTYLIIVSHSSICMRICVCVHCTCTGLLKKNEPISFCNVFQRKSNRNLQHKSQVIYSHSTFISCLTSVQCGRHHQHQCDKRIPLSRVSAYHDPLSWSLCNSMFKILKTFNCPCGRHSTLLFQMVTDSFHDNTW